MKFIYFVALLGAAAFIVSLNVTHIPDLRKNLPEKQDAFADYLAEHGFRYEIDTLPRGDLYQLWIYDAKGEDESVLFMNTGSEIDFLINQSWTEFKSTYVDRPPTRKALIISPE